jgi:hypothetical protein
MDKHVNYGPKKFYNIVPRCQCYKTFFLITDEEAKYAGACSHLGLGPALWGKGYMLASSSQGTLIEGKVH